MVSVTGWLTWVPVLTAAFVGLLYAVGALIKTTQLEGADLSVGDTLPLVPIQQLLNIGIGAAVKAGVLVPMLLLAGLAFRQVEAISEKRLRELDKREREALSRLQAAHERADKLRIVEEQVEHLDGELQRAEVRVRRSGYALALAALGMVLTVPLPFVAIALPMTLIFAQFISPRGSSRAPNSVTARAVTATVVALVCLAAADSYLYPQRLPHVALAQEHATEISGELIVATDSRWYVKLRNGEYLAIPSSLVLSSRIASRHRHVPRPLGQIILDAL